MAGVNKVILIGNLGKDPQLDYTQSGTARCRFSLATTEQYTDRDGQKQERTEWHNVVMWGRQAEVAGEFLKKGRPVYIEGRIQSRQYEDSEGQTKYITEIVAHAMQLLGGPRTGGREGGEAPPPEEPDERPAARKGAAPHAEGEGAAQGAPKEAKEEADDDLPF